MSHIPLHTHSLSVAFFVKQVHGISSYLSVTVRGLFLCVDLSLGDMAASKGVFVRHVDSVSMLCDGLHVNSFAFDFHVGLFLDYITAPQDGKYPDLELQSTMMAFRQSYTQFTAQAGMYAPRYAATHATYGELSFTSDRKHAPALPMRRLFEYWCANCSEFGGFQVCACVSVCVCDSCVCIYICVVV
jgi:hypothetical protein